MMVNKLKMASLALTSKKHEDLEDFPSSPKLSTESGPGEKQKKRGYSFTELKAKNLPEGKFTFLILLISNFVCGRRQSRRKGKVFKRRRIFREIQNGERKV